MAIQNVETKCYILALFIRSDGARLLLGSGEYEFKESQMHFAANTMSNDVVEVQGNDGYLLAGQVRRPGAQSFDGYVGDASTNKATVESLRRNFFEFFRKGYFYKVVYVFPDGTAIQRKRGFLVDAPTVQELYQIYPEYHVALNFEDINYYSYDENAEGEEIYGKSATIGLVLANYGGLIWDELGAVADEDGFVWEPGGAPTTIITVDSIDQVYPVLTITGETVNPSLLNVTTGSLLTYNGTITASQTLVIDMMEQTAFLNGVSVIGNITGDWISFAPGNNRVTYTASNADAPDATIEWQEIVG